MSMIYVVTEKCIRSKYMDCVAVCPVDCFYEGEIMLVINPAECIGCGACVPACKAHAIVQLREGGSAESALDEWAKINAEYANQWPNITQKGTPLPDADKYKDEPEKKRYFSSNPGKGN
jgi:ferredoxin